MIGRCPNCGIRLKEPPFNDKRETNEVMIVLTYRKVIESGVKLKSFEETGYCEICRSTKKDHQEQLELEILQ